jgi:hypothetical protein
MDDEMEAILDGFDAVTEGRDPDIVVWGAIEFLMGYCDDAEDRKEIINRLNYCLAEISDGQRVPEGVVLQ